MSSRSAPSIDVVEAPSGRAVPTRLGRYEVIRHFESGGMAELYIARQDGPRDFARHVVLKTLNVSQVTDGQYSAMFLDEARLAAMLHHHRIVQVYEIGCEGDTYFMAMEYVHGENARVVVMRAIARQEYIPLGLAVAIVIAAAEGLHYAHERCSEKGEPMQIVHRDVSLSNLLVGYDGSTKILDFGIAKAQDRRAQTAIGTLKGKSGYMSPEQCLNQPIDRRSDVFSLGICLYELTTLRRAFKVRDDAETMRRTIAEPVRPPSSILPDYPDELAAIVMRALDKDPERRFQTTLDFLDAIEAFARRADLVSSAAALSRYMKDLFGERPLPWTGDADPTRRVVALRYDSEQTVLDQLDDFTNGLGRSETTVAGHHRRGTTTGPTSTWAGERPVSDTTVYQPCDPARGDDSPEPEHTTVERAPIAVDAVDDRAAAGPVSRSRPSVRALAIRLASAAAGRFVLRFAGLLVLAGVVMVSIAWC